MMAALDEGFCDMRHEAAVVETLSSEMAMDFSIPLEVLRTWRMSLFGILSSSLLCVLEEWRTDLVEWALTFSWLEADYSFGSTICCAMLSISLICELIVLLFVFSLCSFLLIMINYTFVNIYVYFSHDQINFTRNFNEMTSFIQKHILT